MRVSPCDPEYRVPPLSLCGWAYLQSSPQPRVSPKCATVPDSGSLCQAPCSHIGGPSALEAQGKLSLTIGFTRVQPLLEYLG